MKIFGIGLNKTGTKTLGVCLQHFGCKHITYNINNLRAFNRGNFSFLLKKIKQYDSCEDWPWPLMFELLDENFPDAKFILTKRKTPDIWFESLCKLAERTGPSEARRIVYGYDMPHHHRQHHINFYNAHNQKVVDFFKDRPKKLLVVCWEKGDGWLELCRFLEKPHPNLPFPHVNKAPKITTIHNDLMLIFHHIGKTGGTSLRNILKKNYQPNELLELYGPNRGSVEWYRNFYSSLEESQKSTIKCIVAHTAHFIIPVLEQPFQVFCLLRDPVDRVISLYYFAKSVANKDKGVTSQVGTILKQLNWKLEDIYLNLGGGAENDSELHKLFKYFFNGQARTILAPHISTQALKYETTKDSFYENNLEAIVQKYYTVGVQKYFQESVEYFACQFGWQNINYAKDNITQRRPKISELPEDVVTLIRTYNKLDSQIHNTYMKRVENSSTKKLLVTTNQINTLQGPYPIFCRGHSGGRLVCEAFIRNNIEMGRVTADTKDSPFFDANNPLIREIVLNAYHYLQADSTKKKYYQQLMHRCINHYRKTEIQHDGPFGWKLGVSLFTMQVVLDAFPTAKVIHLVRDGRDVMLSRLEARLGNFGDPINRLVVFGDVNVTHYKGHFLSPKTVATYRNELEMLHWVTAVSYGLKGRAYADRYLEVKYEDICQDPIPAYKQIFDFIEIPFLESTKHWLTQTVYAGRIAKWKQLSADNLQEPLQIAEPLLKDLGYIKAHTSRKENAKIKNKPSSYCFVFICQQGELEIKSMLLAASLKRYLRGEFEYVAAIPQPDTRWGIIAEETRALMQTLGVRLVPITNPINDNYPIGHKVACLGIDTSADKVVFLDSDILGFSEFGFDSQSPFSAKPADLPTFTKNVAVWQQVYDLCQLPVPDERVISSVSGESMLPYFNSGVIAVQKGLGFAKVWAECCQTIDMETSITNKRPWLDQIALPIAVAKLNLAYECLDERFNYPAHLKPLPKSPNPLQPFLCHYHSPSVLRREPQLNQLVIELAETYPILKTKLLDSPEWAQLLKPFKLPRLSKHRRFQPEPEAIITGISRSGTSYLCRLLHTLPNCVVINEPTQIFAPLANESRPWRIATFYQELRRDILDGLPIENKLQNGQVIEDTAIIDTRTHYRPTVGRPDFLLCTKNTLAYLSRLHQLKQVMPHAPIIACVRNPLDTIASWKSTFPHLKYATVTNFPVGHVNDPFLLPWQRDCLAEIAATSKNAIKRALLWRYLAKCILTEPQLTVVRYEDLVLQPTKILQTILEQIPNVPPLPGIEKITPSTVRQKREVLDTDDIQAIHEICNQHATELGYTFSEQPKNHVGWVERSETHHVEISKVVGKKSFAHPTAKKQVEWVERSETHHVEISKVVGKKSFAHPTIKNQVGWVERSETHQQLPKAIIILGMHRSGTSALTGVLHQFGVDLGAELMPKHITNERGFWENVQVREINDKILKSLNSTWDDTAPLPHKWWLSEKLAPFKNAIREVLQQNFSTSSLWGIKDPRLCRLLPLWLPILEAAGSALHFVIVTRNPHEVAASLAKRDGLSGNTSLQLWLENNLAAEKYTQSYPRVFVTYDELLQDWQATMAKIARELKLEYAHSIESVHDKITAFLSADLKHNHHLTTPDLDQHLAAWGEKVYQTFIAAAQGDTGQLKTLNPIRHASKKYSRSQIPAPKILACQQICDILIPIYNAYDEVNQCLESVIRHTDAKHRLFLMDDASTDSRILPLLTRLAQSYPQVTVLPAESNLGLVANINRQLNGSANDVVILASDTQVTPDWLEKMERCVKSEPAIGIVSPLSNHAALLSVPLMNQNNVLHTPLVDFANLIEKCSVRRYPRIPTAGGSCLLITRQTLNQLGDFDEAFAPGYGVECDYSMRAWRENIEIACCDDAYIYHVGGASFESVPNIEIKRHQNEQLLDKRWPRFHDALSVFCQVNPLRDIQERIYTASQNDYRPRILHVLSENKLYNYKDCI